MGRNARQGGGRWRRSRSGRRRGLRRPPGSRRTSSSRRSRPREEAGWADGDRAGTGRAVSPEAPVARGRRAGDGAAARVRTSGSSTCGRRTTHPARAVGSSAEWLRQLPTASTTRGRAEPRDQVVGEREHLRAGSTDPSDIRRAIDGSGDAAAWLEKHELLCRTRHDQGPLLDSRRSRAATAIAGAARRRRHRAARRPPARLTDAAARPVRLPASAFITSRILGSI